MRIVFQALCGIIACQLEDKQLDIAKEQLDFMKEIHGGAGNKGKTTSVFCKKDILLCYIILKQVFSQNILRDKTM